MTLASWPPELPRPTRSSFGARLQDPRAKSQRVAGPPSYRTQFSSVAEEVMLGCILSRRELGVFETFHRKTTAYGAALFTMPDPTTDGWPLLVGGQPLLSNGRPILTSKIWTCQFADAMPEKTIAGGVHFNVSFSVLVLP